MPYCKQCNVEPVSIEGSNCKACNVALDSQATRQAAAPEDRVWELVYHAIPPLGMCFLVGLVAFFGGRGISGASLLGACVLLFPVFALLLLSVIAVNSFKR
jgi:hypothetical protein